MLLPLSSIDLSSYVLVGLSLLGYYSLHSLLSYITEGCYLHKSPSQCCDVSLSKEDGWLKILHVLLPLLTLQKYMPSLLVSALLSCSSTLFICNDTPQNIFLIISLHSSSYLLIGIFVLTNPLIFLRLSSRSLTHTKMAAFRNAPSLCHINSTTHKTYHALTLHPTTYTALPISISIIFLVILATRAV